MNQIERLLGKGEGETLEFKESFVIKEILETICAFSNSKGGKILIGVTDEGAAKGVDIGKNTIQDLLNKIKFSLEPMLIPQIEVIKIKKKNVLVIHVAGGVNKPYFLKGVAFKRVAKSNQRIPKGELESLIVEKYKGVFPFEERAVDIGLGAMDESTMRNFSTLARKTRNLELVFYSKKDFSKRLGLVKNGKPMIAAILCFFKNPQTHLPYAIVKCGKLAGATLVREREVSGNIIEQVEGALEFVRENISFYSRINEKGRRVETYEVSIEALREAIVNAIAHRDYSMPSPIYLKIFDDKVEVSNPGELLPPLTPEKLKLDHPSILRNPKLANILFLSGFIERWGYGTNKMVRLCLEHGLKEPEFNVADGFFKLTIFRRSLNELEIAILGAIREGEVTSASLAKKLRINERTARKYLSRLCAMGLATKRKFGRRVSYRSLSLP